MLKQHGLSWLIAGWLLAGTGNLVAQKKLALEENNFLGAYYITVACDKTTHLIFPHDIVYVDLGSADLLAEKVEKVANILKLKGNTPHFKNTNLTVLTGSGQYFSFVVGYEPSPTELTLVLRDHAPRVEPAPLEFPEPASPPLQKASGRQEGVVSSNPKALFETFRISPSDMDGLAQQVLAKKRSVRDLGAIKNEMSFAIHGLYIKDNTYFIHFALENHSHINFDIDFIRFFIRDEKVSRRTSSQEIELFPVHTFNRKAAMVPGKGKLDQVYVMEKFTIPDEKNLNIELFEKKGGRHLAFQVTNADIIKAKLLK